MCIDPNSFIGVVLYNLYAGGVERWRDIVPLSVVGSLHLLSVLSSISRTGLCLCTCVCVYMCVCVSHDDIILHSKLLSNATQTPLSYLDFTRKPCISNGGGGGGGGCGNMLHTQVEDLIDQTARHSQTLSSHT